MERYGSREDRPWETRESGRDEYPTYGERWRREWRGPEGEERFGSQERWGGYRRGRGEDRPEVDPPWVERGPEARRARDDSRGLVEWEDRGPLKWLGDKLRESVGRPPSRGPKGYTRSDERIFDEVCERIARSGVDADDVEVKVEKREVTLTGTVRSRAEKWRLEEVAEYVFGVEDVHNHLKVPRTGLSERGTAGRTDPGSIEDPALRH